MIRMGPGLELPLDAITQTFGILAVRGAGKSNLAAVMAEGMHKARLPFVVVDPVGSWWGLRSSSDGTAPGLDILIFGGRHGDVPLEKTGGQMLADLVVDERVSCVLDISQFSEGDKIRFLLDFSERLYRRNSEPLHLFLEEADDYIPQRPFPKQAELLRAWENIVRRGRARGLGITLITQRSASINKSVLTQIETLFVLRTTSPQDRKAVGAWVEYHGQSREILESLDKLAPGEAWVWSPSWLKLTKRVQIARRSTFDSAATPKNVRGSRPAAQLADVDLGKVRTAMAATIERAKQEDPRELRRRIAELERAAKAKAVAPPAPAPKVTRVEVPVVSEAKLEVLGRELVRIHQQLAIVQQTLDSWRELQRGRMPDPTPVMRTDSSGGATVRWERPAPIRIPTKPATANGHDSKLAGGERRILTALAQYPDGRTKSQVAILTAYAVNGGGFNNSLSALRTRGLMEGSGDQLRITEAGVSALGAFDPLPVGRELLDHWRRRLARAERAALEVLAEAFPHAMSKEELAQRAGYEPNGGGFNNALSRLRTLELIEGRGELRATAHLMEA